MNVSELAELSWAGLGWRWHRGGDGGWLVGVRASVGRAPRALVLAVGARVRQRQREEGSGRAQALAGGAQRRALARTRLRLRATHHTAVSTTEPPQALRRDRASPIHTLIST